MAALTLKKIEEIWHRTSGKCHVCREQHEVDDYGITWSWDHSRARARGGTDYLRNSYVACIRCNSRKGTRSSRSARAEHGYTRAPLSTSKRASSKMGRAGTGGATGALVGFAIGGPPGALLGAILGGVVGHEVDVDE